MPLHSATASGHIGPVMFHHPTYRPNPAITEHRVVSQVHPEAHMARDRLGELMPEEAITVPLSRDHALLLQPQQIPLC